MSIRFAKIKTLREMRFGLAYRNIINANDIDGMDFAEVKWLYNRLIKQIEDEKNEQ